MFIIYIYIYICITYIYIYRFALHISKPRGAGTLFQDSALDKWSLANDLRKGPAKRLCL